VWIIDNAEKSIASAHASPSTRRIILDRSCTSPPARSVHGPKE
jgi:retron-type reverse transcriptase